MLTLLLTLLSVAVMPATQKESKTSANATVTIMSSRDYVTNVPHVVSAQTPTRLHLVSKSQRISVNKLYGLIWPFNTADPDALSTQLLRMHVPDGPGGRQITISVIAVE